MTDRSSEERSRFEKWITDNIPGFRLDRSNDHSPHAPDYIDHGTENSWAVWRAALEDRQEAAPTDDERFHRAQSFLAANELIQAKCKAHGPNFPTTIPQIASFIVDFCKFHAPGVPSEATPNKKDEDWKKLKVGQWFFSDSPDCQDRYAVMERTIGGDSIVCSTPYHHKRAERDMKDIASLHNNADTKLDKAIAWVERCQKEYPENGHYLGMKVVLLGIKEGLR